MASETAISETSFRSLDGLLLAGTLVRAMPSTSGGAVLVHGGGVTREEGGFFARVSDGLADARMSSLRFDLRGHGKSEGRQKDLTLSGVLNDIRAAVDHLSDLVGAGTSISLLGTSFGGGICGLFAARYPERVRRLALLNPLLNYKRRFVDEKPYWHDDRIDEQASRELSERGFVVHSPSFKLGRALLNEVFYVEPHRALGDIQAPTLFVHGTRDTFIPVDSSRWAVDHVKAPAKLVEIDGAQHGFAVHDDPQYLDPQSQRWQAEVIAAVVDWLRQ